MCPMNGTVKNGFKQFLKHFSAGRDVRVATPGSGKLGSEPHMLILSMTICEWQAVFIVYWMIASSHAARNWPSGGKASPPPPLPAKQTNNNNNSNAPHLSKSFHSLSHGAYSEGRRSMELSSPLRIDSLGIVYVCDQIHIALTIKFLWSSEAWPHTQYAFSTRLEDRVEHNYSGEAS